MQRLLLFHPHTRLFSAFDPSSALRFLSPAAFSLLDARPPCRRAPGPRRLPLLRHLDFSHPSPPPSHLRSAPDLHAPTPVCCSPPPPSRPSPPRCCCRRSCRPARRSQLHRSRRLRHPGRPLNRTARWRSVGGPRRAWPRLVTPRALRAPAPRGSTAGSLWLLGGGESTACSMRGRSTASWAGPSSLPPVVAAAGGPPALGDAGRWAIAPDQHRDVGEGRDADVRRPQK